MQSNFKQINSNNNTLSRGCFTQTCCITSLTTSTNCFISITSSWFLKFFFILISFHNWLLTIKLTRYWLLTILLSRLIQIDYSIIISRRLSGIAYFCRYVLSCGLCTIRWIHRCGLWVDCRNLLSCSITNNFSSFCRINIWLRRIFGIRFRITCKIALILTYGARCRCLIIII